MKGPLNNILYNMSKLMFHLRLTMKRFDLPLMFINGIIVIKPHYGEITNGISYNFYVDCPKVI